MSGEAVFILVANILIFAFTAMMIRWTVQRNRFLRKLTQLLKDAEIAAEKERAQAEAGEEGQPPK